MTHPTPLPVRSDLQWTLTRGGSFIACGRTTPTLPPGAYTVTVDNCGEVHFRPSPLHTDDLIAFPDSVWASVLAEVERFWATGERFARLGFAHRRGYLFYGKQGCGKSSLIHQLVGKVVAAGHVAFFCGYPPYFRAAMARFREVEPERPAACVFEDVDAIIKEWGDAELLQVLDGNGQIDKVVNLASTNYPERLDRRIIARPRRFDRLLRIDPPDAGLREAFFARKLPGLAGADLARWVAASAGLPFAALRELDRHTPSSTEFGGAAGTPLVA